MLETAQPQAEDLANQPEIISAPETESERLNANTDTEAKGGEAKTPDEPFMTIRYNKQDKPLSKEEAVVYAQKGMNYDKLQERLNETSAKLSGYEDRTLQDKNVHSIDKQAVIDEQLESFLLNNPGVDPRRLPESVIGKWKTGVPLTEAYLMHQAQQLAFKVNEMEKASAQAEANRANEAASMGGAIGNGAARGKSISEESIKSMTAEELEKNHDRIWAYLTGS